MGIISMYKFSSKPDPVETRRRRKLSAKISNKNTVKCVLACKPDGHFTFHRVAIVCVCQSEHANRSSHRAWSPKYGILKCLLLTTFIKVETSICLHQSTWRFQPACLSGPRINLWGICLISGLQFYVCLYENGGQLSMERHLSMSFPPLSHPFISFCCLFSSSLFSSSLLSPLCILLFQSSDLEDSIKHQKWIILLSQPLKSWFHQK